jgi:hypothetical protein
MVLEALTMETAVFRDATNVSEEHAAFIVTVQELFIYTTLHYITDGTNLEEQACFISCVAHVP